MSELDFLKLLEKIRSPFLDRVFDIIEFFGNKTAIVIVIAVIYFMFNKRLAQKLCFVTVVSFGVNGIVKNLVCRPRPFAVSDLTCSIPDSATGYSFPSGHTQNTSAWTLTLARASGRMWCLIAAALMIAAVAFSRMYVGAHYLTDVLFGALIGVILALVLGKLFDTSKNHTVLFLVCALLLSLFGLLFIFKGDPHFDDFYKGLGMALGLPAATVFEKRFVDFGYDVPVWKKLLRVLIAVAFALAVTSGMKLLYLVSEVRICQLLHVLRYFMLVFVTMGLAPLLMKKLRL